MTALGNLCSRRSPFVLGGDTAGHPAGRESESFPCRDVDSCLPCTILSPATIRLGQSLSPCVRPRRFLVGPSAASSGKPGRAPARAHFPWTPFGSFTSCCAGVSLSGMHVGDVTRIMSSGSGARPSRTACVYKYDLTLLTMASSPI